MKEVPIMIEKKKLKYICVRTLIAGVIFRLCLLVVYSWVDYAGSKWIMSKNGVKEADAIIVLGAYVFPDGKVSDILADRLNVGADLYFAKKAPKIIVSGDHGKVTYDEVNNMRK